MMNGDVECAGRWKKKHAEREWTRHRIGAVAKRFAEGENWALSYKEFRQRCLTAMGEGGDWREDEWGKKDINVGASYAWRRYKGMGKSAAAVIKGTIRSK